MGPDTPSETAARTWRSEAAGMLTLTRLSKALGAVTDQGLISLSGFAIHVSLARIASPDNYGTYVLVYSGILLFAELQNAILLEPMMIFAGSKAAEERRVHFSAVFGLQIVFVTTAVALIWLGCLGWLSIRGPSAVLRVVALAPLGLAGHQFRELTRKVHYTVLDTNRALLTDMMYLSVMAAGIAFAVLTERFDGGAALIILGGAGLSSAAVGLRAAGVGLRNIGPALRPIFVQHWGYGRWMIGTGATRWMTSEFYLVVAALYLAPSGTAALKAVQNIYAPIALFLTGVGNFLLPLAGRFTLRSSARSMNMFAIGTGGSIALGVLVYTAFVMAKSSLVFDVLYSGRYAEFAYLLPLIGIAQILIALLQGPSMALRALNQPQGIFTVNVISAGVTIIVIFPLTAMWGLNGTVIGSLVNLVVASPLWIVHYVRSARTRWPTTGRSSLD